MKIKTTVKSGGFNINRVSRIEFGLSRVLQFNDKMEILAKFQLQKKPRSHDGLL